MMARRRGEELDAVIDRAALRIGGAVVKSPHAGESDGAGAHGARLERDIEVAILEPLGVKKRARLPDRHDFGVGCWIAVSDHPVAGAGDRFALAHDDAADRHLAAAASGASLVERYVHESGHHTHCHARPCAGHPRLYTPSQGKTWMAGTSPARTKWTATASSTNRASASPR